MEDRLEGVTSEINNLFYSTQLKALQVAQTLRIQENRISENDIKTIAHENYNLFSMTQPVFEALQVQPLFQLAKTLATNYNSIIVLLLDVLHKQTQKIAALQKNPTELSLTHQSSPATIHSQNLQLPACNSKRPKLGGVHLYNENYGRYLEDQRIFEQLKIEKEQGIRKRKQELIESMIFQELNHTTDVEETRPGDELANYIHEMKTKGSIYNYIPYENELQDILAYFHNAQNQANEFLIKKDKAQQKSTNPQNFSFSQIQREVQAANNRLRKEVTQKLKAFMDRFRQRQQQLEACLQEKERQYQKSISVRQAVVSAQVQTDLNLSEMIRMFEVQRRQLQVACMALEHLKSSQAEGVFRQNNLKYQIGLKKKDLQKLQQQKKQLQTSIINLKKMIKLEKEKKNNFKDDKFDKSIKQIDLKLQPSLKGKDIIPQQNPKQESKKNIHHDDSYHLSSQMSTSKKLAKTFAGGDWNRKISNDSTPLFRQQDSDVPEQQPLNRTHRQLKKYARYIVDNPKPQPLKIEIQNSPQGTDIGKSQPSLIVTIDFGIQTDSSPFVQHSIISANPMNQNIKMSYKAIENEMQLPSLTSLALIDRNDKLTQSKPTIKTLNSKAASNSKVGKQQPILKQKGKRSNNEIKKQLKSGEAVRKIPVQKEEIMKMEANLIPIIAKEPLKMVQVGQQIEKKHEGSSNHKIIRFVQNETKQQAQVQKENVLERALEVVEQVADQDPDSHKCSAIPSEINSHIQSPYDTYPQKKVSIASTIAQFRQLKKLKNAFVSQLFNIIVSPSVSETFPNLKISTPKHQRNSKQVELLCTYRPDQQKNIASLFSNIHKVTDRISLQKNHFLKTFKNKVQQGYKSGKITIEEVQSIVSVMVVSGEREQLINQEPCLTPWPTNHRHSLPSIDIKQSIPKLTKKYHHHARHSSYSGETKEQIAQDLQQSELLEDIIHFSPIHSNFHSRFQQKHRGCKEGPICSHVMKYLETIMKQIENQRSRQKQSMTLHVENIGKKMEQAEAFMHQQIVQEDLFKKAAKENREVRREKTLGYERRSLQKVGHSKMVELPMIRAARVN